jgi:hypothetical protein
LSGLGRTIGAEVLLRIACRRGRDIDHGPAARSLHGRSRLLDQRVCRHHIERQHVAHRLARHLARVVGAAAAHIVDEHIDLAQLLHGADDELVQIFFFVHIALHGNGAAAQRFNFGLDCLQVRLGARKQRHIGTSLGQRDSACTADTLAPVTTATFPSSENWRKISFMSLPMIAF